MYRLAKEVRDLVDLTVVAYEGAHPLEGVQIKTLAAPRSRVARYYLTPWRMRAAVDELRPDLVHAHGDDFLLRRRGRPTIRSFYGTSWSEATTSTGLRKLNHYVLAGTELISARRADLKLGIAPESVEAFHCDLIFPPFVRRDRPVRRTPTVLPTVLFLGSWGGRKRGWLAERAVNEAAIRLGSHVQLIVVGPEQDRRNWGAGVRHLSGLNDESVSREMATAWCLIAPSSYEGFGIPILEAFEHSLGVVASSNPGSEYIAEQGDSDLPLDLVSDDLLGQAVADRLREGPILSPFESVSAQALVNKLAGRSSGHSLVQAYLRCHDSQSSGRSCA